MIQDSRTFTFWSGKLSKDCEGQSNQSLHWNLFKGKSGFLSSIVNEASEQVTQKNWLICGFTWCTSILVHLKNLAFFSSTENALLQDPRKEVVTGILKQI